MLHASSWFEDILDVTQEFESQSAAGAGGE
jgi:hypothetical protein